MLSQQISTPIRGVIQLTDPTDERTDELTENSLTQRNNPHAPERAREEAGYIPVLAEMVEQWIDYVDPKERWPLVRSGERTPIPWGVRRAVYVRDLFSCRICGISVFDEETFELDHITPWSAGGSDRSSNLRVLCKPCNQDRSNWRDGTERIPVLPVTWWCIHCWADGMTQDEHGPRCKSKRNLETCAYVVPAFGAVPRINFNEADQVAFCAHCRHNSWTEVTL